MVGTVLVLAVVGCDGRSPPPASVHAPTAPGRHMEAPQGPLHPDAMDADEPASAPEDQRPGPQQAPGPTDGAVPGPTPRPDRPEPAPAPDAAVDDDPSEALYAADALPHFELELPEASIAALQTNPRSYAPGALRYGDEHITDIGVRLKGEGSFRQLDDKPALKLKFDAFVDKQSFRGLRRMTLNNMVEDPSFLAERLAYHVFRTAGLPAPRCNSALVSINGEPYGVYANVETEDKTFLRRWFDDDDGNLYEEGQVDFVPGAEPMFDLETNESENDRTDLARLIDLFARAADQTLLADLAPALDTEHFLRFTAAEAAVNQWDMYAYTVFYPNNFRLYHDPTRSVFTFIPWGMDLSMKPYRDSGKPHIDPFALARHYDRESGQVTSGLIFQRCLQSAPCERRYREVLAEMADHFEALELEALARRYHGQIREHVLADPRTEYSRADFERAYGALLRTVAERPAAIRAALQARNDQ